MDDLIDPENNLPKSNIPPIKKKHIEVNPLALNKNIKLMIIIKNFKEKKEIFLFQKLLLKKKK